SAAHWARTPTSGISGPARRPRRTLRRRPAAVQPDAQALGVELDVHLQQLPDPGGVTDAQALGVFDVFAREPVHQALVPVRTAVAPSGQVHHAVDLRDQAGAKLLHPGDPAVVGDVHGFRRLGQDAPDRTAQRVRIELHRRSAGHDAGAARRIQLTVGDAEGIAAEPAAAARVPY